MPDPSRYGKLCMALPMPLDRRDQLAPRRHPFNLRQEAVTSRLPLLARVLELGKTRLHRRSLHPRRSGPLFQFAPRSASARRSPRGIDQCFPSSMSYGMFKVATEVRCRL